MKKILRAAVAAMLFATGAQAATVDFTVTGAFQYDEATMTVTQTDTPVSGQLYQFYVTPGSLAMVPTEFLTGSGAYSEMVLTISGQGVTEPFVKSIGFGDMSFKPFGFSWFWKDTGPQSLTFQGSLKLYSNASPDYGNMPGTGANPPPIVGLKFVNGPANLFEIPIEPITWMGANSAAPETTPVPIGGTLPLMLSALGLGAFVMRRRAKAALA